MLSEEKMDEVNSLKGDIERWKWVKENQNLDILVQCDNDDTFVIIEETGELLFSFDQYIGWTDGVFNLLDVMNVRAECV